MYFSVKKLGEDRNTSTFAVVRLAASTKMNVSISRQFKPKIDNR